MVLKPGTRLRTSASPCEVLVVRGTDEDAALQCAGGDMSIDEPAASPAGGPSPGADAIALGKRYHDEASGLEVLCVKAGAGPLTFGGRALQLRAAKPLPASD